MLTIGCKKLYPLKNLTKIQENVKQQGQCKVDIGIDRKQNLKSALSEFKVKLNKLS